MESKVSRLTFYIFHVVNYLVYVKALVLFLCSCIIFKICLNSTMFIFKMSFLFDLLKVLSIFVAPGVIKFWDISVFLNTFYVDWHLTSKLPFPFKFWSLCIRCFLNMIFFIFFWDWVLFILLNIRMQKTLFRGWILKEFTKNSS